MSTFTDQVEAIASLANFTDEEKAAMIAALPHVQDAVAAAPGPTVGGQALAQAPSASQGDAGTVTLPVTGHTLTLPLPQHTMIGGYLQYVAAQAGGNENAVGAFAMGGAAAEIAKSNGLNLADKSTWPEIVDRFFNPAAYQTPEGKAKAAAWANQPAVKGTGKYPIGSLSQADKAYLYNSGITNVKALTIFSGSLTDINAAQSAGGLNPPDGSPLNPTFKALVDKAKASA